MPRHSPLQQGARLNGQAAALSPTMTAGNIAKWMVKPGDKVGPGDHLCDVETDKATMEYECQEEGFVSAILVDAGSRDVPVGKVCDTALIICLESNVLPEFPR